MLQVLGILSGVLSGLSYLPYIKDIFLRTTKPERASWLIWSILGSIAFFSQFAEGATWSLYLTGIDTLGVIIIFLLSIKYGVGGLTKKDIIALIAAGIGLLLWYLTNQAVIALLMTMLIDAAGAILTVIKSYEHPETETLTTWTIISIAAILGMLSVGEINFVLLAYPFYIFLANFAVVLAILAGRKQIKNK